MDCYKQSARIGPFEKHNIPINYSESILLSDDNKDSHKSSSPHHFYPDNLSSYVEETISNRKKINSLSSTPRRSTVSTLSFESQLE